MGLGRLMKNIHSIFLILVALFCLVPQMSHADNLNLIDEVRRKVSIPFPPKRMISLAPNITEILFSLGLDDAIVGVSIHCNFPKQAQKKARVGSYISLDFERILFLHPDLVIATA